jgi:hypothetical protein
MASSSGKARTRRPGTTKVDAAFGLLVAAAVLSWLAYVALDHLTAAPDALAMWCSGAIAGLAAVIGINPHRIGRRSR